MRTLRNRWNDGGLGYWIGIPLLFAVMGVAQVCSVLQETQTWDEAGHLTAGYVYLTTGHIAFYTDQPPLRAVFAVPLLFMRLHLPVDHPTWRERNQTDFATQFLYTNPYHPDTLLIAGRSVAIALTLLFGTVLAWWTWHMFGPRSALIASALFAFEPNLIAHGRYITTDMLAAFTFFLAAVAWGAYLREPHWLRLVGAGAALGLAFLAKYSAVCLGPVFVLLAIVRWRQGKISLLTIVKSLAAVAGIGAAVVLIGYGPETLRYFEFKPMVDLVDQSHWAGSAVAFAAKALALRAHPFLVGLYEVLLKSETGQGGYLLGRFSQTGWWYYFPVVFAVKTPLAVLALLAASVACWLWQRPGLAAIPFEGFVLAIAAVTYFGFSMMSALNLGVRHLLPVYPLLCISIAALMSRVRCGTWLAMAGCVLLTVESAGSYPNYLAFFNAAAGGPKAGPRYLLDSNIDWGQDVKKLRSWLHARNIESVCMFYFGNTGVEFYGIPMKYLPRTWETESRERLDCVAAVSVTPLYGLYVPRDSYAWLREKEPAARVGWSIYVYDLRRRKSDQN